jgi:hypothetical protein
MHTSANLAKRFEELLLMLMEDGGMSFCRLFLSSSLLHTIFCFVLFFDQATCFANV